MADYWDTLQQAPVQEDPGLWNGLFPQSAYAGGSANLPMTFGSFAGFRKASDIEDRRLENHHRPMLAKIGLPRGEVRWSQLGIDAGLGNIEDQIADNDAKLATSPLAEALGRLDIYNSMRPMTQ